MKFLKITATYVFGILILTGCGTGKIGSCSGDCGGGGTRAEIYWVNCDEAIEYQDNSWQIDGIEYPVKNVEGGIIKVGSLKVTPTTLREASDTIQALDLEFKRECVAAINRSGQFSEAHNSNAGKAKDELEKLLSDLTNAKTEQEYKDAVNNIKLLYSRQRVPKE